MSLVKNVIFDIETAPGDNLTALMPEFDPPANFKDPEKIKEAIEKKRQSWLEDAALSATTGKILCIGIKINDNFRLIEGHEKQILIDFWQIADSPNNQIVHLVGHNIKYFDVPFLVRRSWINDVVPPFLQQIKNNMIDTMDSWLMGSQRTENNSCSLDMLAKVFGLPGKVSDSKNFFKTWTLNKPLAIEHVRRDVEIVEQIANKMNLL